MVVVVAKACATGRIIVSEDNPSIVEEEWCMMQYNDIDMQSNDVTDFRHVDEGGESWKAAMTKKRRERRPYCYCKTVEI